MRAWIISNAFVSVHKCGEGSHVRGDDDAGDARWLTLKAPSIGNGTFDLSFYNGQELAFSISGTYQEEDFGGGSITHVNPCPIAFDHAQIVAQAFLRLLSFDLRKLVLFFLPEKFTLGQYIDVYQYLTQTPIDHGNISNIRRQLTSTKNPLLEVCEGEIENLAGRAHAPAKLYRRRGKA